MTISITSPKLGVNIGVTETASNHTLGDVVFGSQGTKWVYVQAAAALSAKKWAAIDEAYQLYALTSARAASGFGITVPQISFANDDYGWVPVEGAFGSAFAKKSCAADSALYVTTTAGAVDDTATGHFQIVGALLISAASSNSGFFGCRFLHEPYANKFADRDAGGL